MERFCIIKPRLKGAAFLKSRLIHIAIAVFCAAATAAGVFVNGQASERNQFYRWNNQFADLLYQNGATADGTVMVIGIDEQSLEQIGPYQSWTRGVMADIIEALNADPDNLPAAIGIDVMYIGNTNEDDDGRLAQAAVKYPNVVVGSNILFGDRIVEIDGVEYHNDLDIKMFEEPFEKLKASSRQGHVNTMSDNDGIIRHNMHMVQLPDGRVSKSFAGAVLDTYFENTSGGTYEDPPVNLRGFWYVPFSGKPGDLYSGYCVADVLNGDMPPEVFADCIVLIGAYAPGFMDSYYVSIDRSVQMYGVEIHANIVEALRTGNYKADVDYTLQSIIIFLAIIFMYFVFLRQKPILMTAIAVAFAGGYVTTVFLLGRAGVMLTVIYFPLAVLIMYFGFVIRHYLVEVIEKRKLTGTFKKYVAPQVVDEIIKMGEQALKLGGAKQHIACMFVDIRGFTPMSEALAPEDVVSVLNEYLDLASKAVFKHEGTLDKFIGDATMAIYNAPLELDDYAYKAVLTAWDIVKGSDELNKKLYEKHGRSVSFGIGLNLGDAVVGNIGTDVRMDYTAIGDTVNTAARLESQAKPGQVLLSESLYEAVKDRIKAVDLGEISLKGKANGVKVFGLYSINEYENTQTPLETAEDQPGKTALSYTGNMEAKNET